MPSGVYTTNRDMIQMSNGQAADTQPVVTFNGGDYYILAAASAWGGGNLDLQTLAYDGTTYVSVLSATITANKGVFLEGLPAGQYKFVLTTTNGCYATCVRTRRGASP